MIRITFIADTHAIHQQLNDDLPGGDIIIHAGDFTSRGFLQEVKNFCDWYDRLNNYTYKIFIAGNHELGLEEHPEEAMGLIDQYDNIIYLHDKQINIFGQKIWGTPWQPEFYNWAFNLPRNGEELEAKWNLIPLDTDILVTHCPPFGRLDEQRNGGHMGCELLKDRVDIVKPKIHVFGHCHVGRGYREINGIHTFNAANLNNLYMYRNLPFTIDWDPINNKINFV